MNQEQTTPIPVSPIPEQSERRKINNVITIIALIVFLPVGLILMWLLASWSKKAKNIITVMAGIFLVVILPIIIMTFITMKNIENFGARARDSKRMSDMSEIFAIQGIYWIDDNGQYYQSVNYPLSIPSYSIVEMPMDPLTGKPYGWIDNTGNPQRFCAYVDLETNGFFIASHKGAGEIATEPRILADCEVFSPAF